MFCDISYVFPDIPVFPDFPVLPDFYTLLDFPDFYSIGTTLRQYSGPRDWESAICKTRSQAAWGAQCSYHMQPPLCCHQQHCLALWSKHPRYSHLFHPHSMLLQSDIRKIRERKQKSFQTINLFICFKESKKNIQNWIP